MNERIRCLREFENDVKIYGIKTGIIMASTVREFENDVKIYGIKTIIKCRRMYPRLRMM